MLLLFLPFFQQLEYVARLGNPGQVDLGLDVRLARSFSLDRRGLGRKMLANLFRLIVLDGARVSLLLGDPDIIQYVQNCFALYLKLSGQIIVSNFHPFRLPSRHLLRAHIDLTAVTLHTDFLVTTLDRSALGHPVS
jgi:hypothetical protein